VARFPDVADAAQVLPGGRPSRRAPHLRCARDDASAARWAANGRATGAPLRHRSWTSDPA